jgi:cyclopropane fatty-acyl-phospholipid synthase-like methyltransferase
MSADERSPEQIRHHYEVEKELASRLRNASREERVELYSKVYEELWKRVPDHPMLTRKVDSVAKAQSIQQQLALLEPYLRPEMVFLEIGPGDCTLSFALCQRVAQVYGV